MGVVSVVELDTVPLVSRYPVNSFCGHANRQKVSGDPVYFPNDTRAGKHVRIRTHIANPAQPRIDRGLPVIYDDIHPCTCRWPTWLWFGSASFTNPSVLHSHHIPDPWSPLLEAVYIVVLQVISVDCILFIGCPNFAAVPVLKMMGNSPTQQGLVGLLRSDPLDSFRDSLVKDA